MLCRIRASPEEEGEHSLLKFARGAAAAARTPSLAGCFTGARRSCGGPRVARHSLLKLARGAAAPPQAAVLRAGLRAPAEAAKSGSFSRVSDTLERAARAPAEAAASGSADALAVRVRVALGGTARRSEKERPHLGRATPASFPRNHTRALVHCESCLLGSEIPAAEPGSCRPGHPGRNDHYARPAPARPRGAAPRARRFLADPGGPISGRSRGIRGALALNSKLS